MIVERLFSNSIDNRVDSAVRLMSQVCSVGYQLAAFLLISATNYLQDVVVLVAGVSDNRGDVVVGKWKEDFSVCSRLAVEREDLRLLKVYDVDHTGLSADPKVLDSSKSVGSGN